MQMIIHLSLSHHITLDCCELSPLPHIISCRSLRFWNQWNRRNCLSDTLAVHFPGVQASYQESFASSTDP